MCAGTRAHGIVRTRNAVGGIRRGDDARGEAERLAKFSCGLKPIGGGLSEGALHDCLAPLRKVVAMLAERRR